MPIIVASVDLSHLRGTFSGRRTIDGVRDGMRELGRILVPALQQAMTHPEGPGAQSLRFQTREDGGLLSLSISGNSYLRYNLQGTGPHDIEARNGGALAFEWNGRSVFFRKVHHPGTKPDRWDRRGWAAIRPAALRILGQALVSKLRS